MPKKIRKSAVQPVSLTGTNDPPNAIGGVGITEGMYVHFCIKKKNMCWS